MAEVMGKEESCERACDAELGTRVRAGCKMWLVQMGRVKCPSGFEDFVQNKE